MPEHFHLLISEPRVGKLSSVIQVLKQRVSRRCRSNRRKSANQMELWEDLGPPELWRWSSYRDYWLGETGKVKIGN
jgi:REP element-mobilizing transposase RayT